MLALFSLLGVAHADPNYPFTTWTYTVPANVFSMKVTVKGGGGGGGGGSGSNVGATGWGGTTNGGFGNQGSNGAAITATIRVRPGDVVTGIDAGGGVGGVGGANDASKIRCTDNQGFNINLRTQGNGGGGLGNGGNGSFNQCPEPPPAYFGGGGGGGGASSLSVNGEVVIVAGGGGGGGGSSFRCYQSNQANQCKTNFNGTPSTVFTSAATCSASGGGTSPNGQGRAGNGGGGGGFVPGATGVPWGTSFVADGGEGKSGSSCYVLSRLAGNPTTTPGGGGVGGIWSNVGGAGFYGGQPASATGTSQPSTPPAPLTGSNSGVRVVTDNQFANGSATDVLEAFIRDDSNNPVGAGVLVTFSATPNVNFGAGVGAANTCTTDSTSMCSVNATSTVAGTYSATSVTMGGTVLGGTFTANGNNYMPSPQPYTFVFSPPAAGNSGVRVVTNNQLANGSATDMLEAFIRDASNRPIGVGVVVSFSGTPNVRFGTGAIGAPGACTTNAASLCQITATSTVSGTYSATSVTIGGAALGGAFTASGNNYLASPQPYTFLAGPPVAAKSGLRIAINNQIADGIAADVLEAFIRDANNNPVGTGTIVTFSGTANVKFGAGAIGAPSTCTTSAAGLCTINATSTVVGTYSTTSVTVGGTPLTGTFTVGTANYLPSPQSYTFLPIPSPSNSGLRVVTNNQVANGIAGDVLEAFIRTASGTPIGAGTIVTFGATPNVNFGAGVGVATTCTTTAASLCQITSKSVVAGTYSTTSVTVAGVALGGSFTVGVNIYLPSPQPYTFVVGPPAASNSGVRIVTNNQIADGVATDVLEAFIRDASGSPAGAGTVVTFSATPNVDFGTGVGIANTCTTTAASLCQMTAKTTVAATYSATSVTIGGTALGGTFTAAGNSYQPSPRPYTFLPIPSAASSGMRVVTNNQVANGAASDVLEVFIRTAGGTPIGAGTVVTFSATPNVDFGAGVGIVNTCTTTAASLCQITAKTIVAATYSTTSVTVGGAALGGTFTVGTSNYLPSPQPYTFVAGPPVASKSGVRVVTNNKPASGLAADSDVLEAFIRDANNNPVGAGTVVTFSATANVKFGTGAIGALGTCTTSAAGLCTINVTSTVAGTYSATSVTVGGTALAGTFTAAGNNYLPSPQPYTFVVGPPVAGNSGVRVVTNNRVANGVATDVLEAFIRDASNNPIGAGTVVTFNATPNVDFGAGIGIANTCTTTTASLCQITAKTTVAGTYSATSVTIGGTALGGTFTIGTSTYLPSPQPYTFVAGGPVAANSGVRVVSNNQIANGVATDVLEAFIRDASGNPVGAGTVVTFSATANVKFGAGAIGALGTCTTTAASLCTINATSTVAGTYSMTSVTIAGVALSGTFTVGTNNYLPSPQPYAFVAGPPVAGNSGVRVVTNNQVADGLATDVLEAFVRDAFGNPVGAGIIVTFSATPNANFGAGVGAASTCTTTTASLCQMAITSTVAATYNATSVTIGGAALSGTFTAAGNSYLPSPRPYTFLPVPSPSNSGLRVVTNNQVANGIAGDVLEAFIRTASGTPIGAGTIVTFGATPNVNFGAGVGVATTCTTTAASLCQITSKSVVAGTYSTTSVTVAGVALGGSFTVGVNIYLPSPQPYTFVVGPPAASNSGVRIVTNNQIADGVATDVLEAFIRDASGSPAGAGTVVTFSATPNVDFGTGVGIANTCTTTAASLCQMTAKTTVAATYSATSVTIGGTALGGTFTAAGNSYQPSPRPYTFLPIPSAASSGMRVVTNNQVANGAASDVLEVFIRTAGGTPIGAGTVVTFSATPNVDFGAGVGIVNTCTTTAASLCQITAKTIVAATYSTTSVTVGGAALGGTFTVGTSNYLPSPQPYTFVAGPPDASKSGVRVVTNNKPTSGLAADSDVLEAYIRDAFGNPVGAVTVNFASTPTVAFNGGTVGVTVNCVTSAAAGVNFGACQVTSTSTVAGSKSTPVSIGGTALGGTFTAAANGNSYTPSPAVYAFVPFVPSVRIVKNVVAGSGNNVFNFALSGLSAGTDSITVAGVNSGSGSSSLTGTAGTGVTISETSPAGWPANPVSASCVDSQAGVSGNPTGPLGTLSGKVLSIPAANMRNGAAFTCTFTNAFGFSVMGRVFNDNGIGAGTANDGVTNGTEAGRPGISVKLTNCAATILATATTDSSGNYLLSVPFSTAANAQLCVEETSPASSVSTGASVGSTALPSGLAVSVGSTSYTYTRTSTPDRIAFIWNGTGHAGLNFGDVDPNTFVANGAKTGMAGNTVSYPHTFTAQSGGSVSFDIASAVANPALAGWIQKIFADPGCKATLQAGAALLFPPATPTVVVAGQEVCIIVQEFIPANAINGYTDTVTVRASFNYTNANPALAATFTVTDITTVGASTGEVTKEVRNVTQSGVFGVSNKAKSGEVLEYRLVYTNNGVSPVTGVVLNDMIPNYTTFVSAVAGPMPTAMSNCQKTTPANVLPAPTVACAFAQAAGGTGPVSWHFDGTLNPGATGSVLFQVKVD